MNFSSTNLFVSHYGLIRNYSVPIMKANVYAGTRSIEWFEDSSRTLNINSELMSFVIFEVGRNKRLPCGYYVGISINYDLQWFCNVSVFDCTSIQSDCGQNLIKSTIRSKQTIFIHYFFFYMLIKSLAQVIICMNIWLEIN